MDRGYGPAPPDPEFPDDIPGLALHLDASSIVGFSDGQPVGSWADIGPNGHLVSQATPANMPLYRESGISGRPALEFDGSNDNLAGSFGTTYAQPNTVFAVVEFLSVPSSDASPWMDGSSSSNRHWMGSTQANVIGIWAGDPFLNSGIDKSTTPMIVRGVFNGGGGNSSVHAFGTQFGGSTGNQGWSGVTLGSRWDGARNVHIRIAEIVAYNRELDESESGRVDDYLGEKYNLHPPIEMFGSFGSGGKWAYGALASNGSIYGTPYQTSSILKLDPVSRAYTTFNGPGSSNNQWIGMIEAPDGRLFCIPARNPNVLVIDPTDDSYQTFAAADYNEYYGGALADNGIIYCCPFSRDTVLKIDPSTDTSSTIGPVHAETSGVSGQWGWFIKDPVSGKLYAAPRSEPSVLVVDPATDGISYITGNVPAGTRKYTGGLVASTGEIWMIPRDATSFLVVDPSNDTARTVGTLPIGGNKWNGGTVVGDWLVMYPRSFDKIVAVNAVTEEIRMIDTFRTGSDKWVGSVDAGGESFLIPYFSQSIGVVDASDLDLE